VGDLHGEIRVRVEARQQRAREVAPTWGKSVRNGGVGTTFTHQAGQWEAAEATKVFVYHENPTVVLRNCAEDLRILDEHRPCACDLAREVPHCVTHRCPARRPHTALSSLARRYGIEENDRD
jgi:hypothetical protein